MVFGFEQEPTSGSGIMAGSPVPTSTPIVHFGAVMEEDLGLQSSRWGNFGARNIRPLTLTHFDPSIFCGEGVGY